jgi:hypothetical protein
MMRSLIRFDTPQHAAVWWKKRTADRAGVVRGKRGMCKPGAGGPVPVAALIVGVAG